MPAARVVTPRLLNAIRKMPNLPPNTWYAVGGVVLSCLNRPEEVPHIFHNATTKNDDNLHISADFAKQLLVARQMREALIKASVIGGLPRTINAITHLTQATDIRLVDPPHGYSPTGRSSDVYDASPPAILLRGRRFFDTIYDKISSKVMRQMDTSGTEDLGLTARLMYGYLLSNDKVLSPAQTSFVIIGGLITYDVNAQLKGHLVGATHHEGVSIEHVKAVRQMSIMICEAAGMQRLDDASSGSWGWRQPVADL